MPADDGDAAPASRRGAAALLWLAFFAVLLTLICCDLDVNPILDEQQWLQSGLATAHSRFLKSGLVSGPLYGLVLGVIFGVFYVAGALVGAFHGTLDFVSWFLSHQGVFYFIARGLTAGIAAGGLALLARTLSGRIGGLAASTLVVGFAFTAPAMDRIAYATPHAAMIGFSAALIGVLIRARDGDRPIWWCLAGAIVAVATSAITIGLGLGLLAFWGAAFAEPNEAASRRRRLGLVLAGFVAGAIVFAYPALLSPSDYWHSNIRYQLTRQILSDDGGRGRLLREWLVEGLPLWVAGIAGAIRGRFREGRSLAVGAVATAAGYVVFLAAATRSAQVSYSLAALPCLAYAASGLVGRLRERPAVQRAILVAAVFGLPALLAIDRIRGRILVPHPRVTAAARVMATQPAGTTLLVDAWYGPRLKHPRLLLAPYGRVGQEWARDPGFLASLERRLPPEHRRWNVIPYPQELSPPRADSLRQVGVDVVLLSATMRDREPAWGALIADGTLRPEPPDASGPIVFYRLARSP